MAIKIKKFPKGSKNEGKLMASIEMPESKEKFTQIYCVQESMEITTSGIISERQLKGLAKCIAFPAEQMITFLENFAGITFFNGKFTSLNTGEQLPTLENAVIRGSFFKRFSFEPLHKNQSPLQTADGTLILSYNGEFCLQNNLTNEAMSLFKPCYMDIMYSSSTEKPFSEWVKKIDNKWVVYNPKETANSLINSEITLVTMDME